MNEDVFDFEAADMNAELQPIVPLDHGPGMVVLREYQEECVDAVFEKLQTFVSTLVVMATGLGKTQIMAEIAYRWPHGRVLVMAHREELIDQAAHRIGEHMDEKCSIEMGSRKESRQGHGFLDKSKVLITSVQTMSRDSRMQWFSPHDFSLILTDESHHAVGASYRKVYEYFHQNPQLRHVGVTATPKRADEAALGDIYHSVAYEMDIREGIDDGYLVDVEQRLVVIEGLDFSKCRTTAGDLNSKDLAAAMLGAGSTGLMEDAETLEQEERMLHAIVSPTIQESQGRPTIIFGVTKAHAERLCEICLRHPGVTAEFVTDDTDRETRSQIVKRFKEGKTQILVNVSIFTEGFDARVDVVAIARPTKSESLYRQMIGRGTRPLSGLVDRYDTAQERREAIANSAKPAMTVLDFVGVSGRHNLLSAVDILGGNYSQDIIDSAKERLRLSGQTKGIDELLAEEQQSAIERKAKAMQLAKEQSDREAASKAKAEEERKKRQAEWDARKGVKGHATYRTEAVSPWISVTIPEQVGIGKYRGGSTEPQIKRLMRLGISEEAACKYTKGQAGAVIDKLQKQSGGDFVIPFGKYMGNKVRSIPSGWIEWAEKNISDPNILRHIKQFRNEPNIAEVPEVPRKPPERMPYVTDEPPPF